MLPDVDMLKVVVVSVVMLMMRLSDVVGYVLLETYFFWVGVVVISIPFLQYFFFLSRLLLQANPGQILGVEEGSKEWPLAVTYEEVC
jgi:hypothetical protein